MKKLSKGLLFLLFISAAILVAACSQVLPKGCTQEAKICPDGSSVGRQGPNCEFAPCPSNESQIANPASKYCQDNGGTLEIKTASDGSQEGFCFTKDGFVCDEWQYFRGECPNSTDTSNMTIPDVTQPIDQAYAGCSDVHGEYDPQYKECTGISKEQCDQINGTFNECASACRHNPNAQVCTLQCVIVCQLH